MIDKSPFKAGIFFSHYECFGHTSRVIAVSQIFKKKFPSGNFFFIQGGVFQPMANLEEYGQVYSLPSPVVNRNNFRSPAKEIEMPYCDRVQACVDIVVREKPDLFLTEFFPLGRVEFRYELIAALVKAVGQGSQLWAIAGYPLLLGSADGWREKILELYQKVIVFAPLIEKDMIAAACPNMQDRRKYMDFFKRHEKKIVFAGYLLPQGNVINYKEDENLSKSLKPKRACRVAVVRGGGAVYPKIIAQAIRASDLLGEQYYLTVVAGPSTTVEEWHLFSSLLAQKKIKNVTLLKAIVDYEGLIRESDVCVTTASYHTSVMLLKYVKKSVVIPFEGYAEGMSFCEQLARAQMLKETIGADILQIKDLTAVGLADFIKRAGQRKTIPVDVPKEWFTGGDFLDKALTELFVR